MEKLKRAVDAFIEQKQDVIDERASSEDREEMIDALRTKFTEEIIAEIKDKYKDEIISEAMKEIEDKKKKQELDGLKKLMWEGFVVAFIVGLAVNQITDVISCLKGTMDFDKIGVTIIITTFLVVVVVVVYLYSFFKNALSFFHTL